MIYKEITVNTTTEGSELVAYILEELGSEGVSIYDSSDILELYKSDIIWDYIDENVLKSSEIVKVKGFYNQDEYEKVYLNLLEKLEELKENSPFNLGSLEVSVMDINDEDWVNVWKKYYKPIHINDIVIVPCWLDYQKQENEKVVYLDPGMAFGTGEHESTKLCLTLFSELDTIGKDVLDVGTGSGILGITASVCGAKSVYMSDIDAVAIESCKQNAKLNKLGDYEIALDDLVATCHKKGDIVFANITADILIKLSKDIIKLVKKDGYIILSGIIKARYDEVLKAYLDSGFTLDKSMVMGEWCGIRFKV